VNSTKARSLTKALTWRVIAIVSTFVLAWYYTKDIAFTVSFTIVSNVINFILYYIHERTWLRVRWGRSWNKETA